MSNEVRIVRWDDPLKQKFFDFAQCVHPKEQHLKDRMQWFTFANPVVVPDTSLPGLAIVTADSEVIGQFLICPFEFQLRQKKHIGYFGYDFFVKEEYRTQGAGALLFVQGVRMYAPFVGVGLTHIVEKISKSAGIQTVGLLKKFIWVRNPVTLGSELLKQRSIKDLNGKKKPSSDPVLPQEVDIFGLKFQHSVSLPNDLPMSCGDEVLEPARSREFLKWRFWDCPWAYSIYIHHDPSAPLWLVVRTVSYENMNLLLIVDHRSPLVKPGSFEIILKAAKRISEDGRLDGVVMASTYAPMDEILKREGFQVTGRPSSVIAYLPSDEFDVPVKAISLTMADSDLDFNFPNAH